MAGNHSNATSGTITLVERRTAVLKLVAMAAGFALVSALVLSGWLDMGRYRGSFVTVVFIAGFLMGLVGLAAFVPRVFRSQRVIRVLDDEGFDDRVSLMAAGRVRWSEVAELQLVKISGNASIVGKLRDPRRVQNGGAVWGSS